MESTIFIDIVQKHAQFDSREQARRTVEAVLEAISESIARGAAEDAAEQLPHELAEHLLVDETEEADPIDYPAFLDRICEESGFDRKYAASRVGAVILALERALEEFEFDNIHGQLPEEYDAVFNTDAAATEDSLTERVAAETDLDERTAQEATEATLDVLSERLTLGEAEDLGVYFDEEEAAQLIDRDSPEAADFGSEEFVSRVASKEGSDEETAANHVTDVFAGMESMAPEETTRASDQLGSDYAELFPRT